MKRKGKYCFVDLIGRVRTSKTFKGIINKLDNEVLHDGSGAGRMCYFYEGAEIPAIYDPDGNDITESVYKYFEMTH